MLLKELTPIIKCIILLITYYRNRLIALCTVWYKDVDHD